jgi:tetratricopeptide (TPR) repeat protein
VSIAAISLLVIAGAAEPASAQNAEAELLFRDGDKLMAAGDYAKACDAFEASNRIEARAGTLIRLGDCREKNNQLASAWSAYSDALSRVKDPKKREIAAARVAALEPRLSQLTISVPDESRVAGLVITRNGTAVDAALWNRGAPVDGGEYVIAGRAPGHEEWSTKVTVPSEAGKVSVEVPRFKELAKLAPPPIDDRAMFTEEPVDSPSMMTGRRKIALGVAGAGIVFLTAGAVTGASAKGLESDAETLCEQIICTDHAEANDTMDKARSRARLANLSYGVAGLCGAAAAVLWFTGGPSRADAVAVVPAIGPDSAGAVVQGRF